MFVNPDARYIFGKTSHQALTNFLEEISKKKGIKFFMPPSIYAELLHFIEPHPVPPKIILIERKPPAKYEKTVPALFLYEFIEEMRERINKGLRIGEKYVRRVLKTKEEGETIKSLRQEYRVALREGIIDSKEDFDLLLLAKELDAYLATSDNGLITWAHKLGIKCITAQELKALIENAS